MSNTPLSPCWLIQSQFSMEQLTFQFYGAATPGFKSLIPAPSVSWLIRTEPLELFCSASNLSTTDPFYFVKQKQETVEVFLQLLFKNMGSFKKL